MCQMSDSRIQSFTVLNSLSDTHADHNLFKTRNGKAVFTPQFRLELTHDS